LGKHWNAISDGIKKLKERSRVGKALSYEDESRLLAACGASLSPSLLPLFVLGIDTGLRAAEQRALRYKDVVITWSGSRLEGHLIVPTSKTDAGTHRMVPLTARLITVLRDWFARFPNTQPGRLHLLPSLGENAARR
jgi:integrase